MIKIFKKYTFVYWSIRKINHLDDDILTYPRKYMAKITTIKIEEETKKRLDKLKTHRRDTYEDILKNIFRILNITRANPAKARFILKKIDRIQRKISQKNADEESIHEDFFEEEEETSKDSEYRERQK